MPSAPPIACPCGGSRINGKCDRCGRSKRGQHSRTSGQRGYDYQWQLFRMAYLHEHPLCMDCRAEDRVEPATEVHHRTKIRHNPTLRLEPSNCMALCGPCHDERTARGE